MRKWAAGLSILLVIAFFCFLSVGLASADSYTYTLSGGPSPETPLVVDDDLEVKVNGKTVFVDDDGVSTHDGRATWKGAPITFSASPGDVLRIIATNPGGVDIELSELYLHVNGQSLKLSDGVPKAQSEEYTFFDERFTISIPTPKVSILDYSPSPVHGGEDANVKVSWNNIPAGWKLVVSLEESEWNYTRLADDVSKKVSESGEDTFTLKVYPTTETHSEAKVCACFYNEKEELKILDKKNIIVSPNPSLQVSIISYSPSPVREEDDLTVKVSWSNIPAGWKLVVSLEESDVDYTRLADDVSKMVSDSEEDTFTLKVYPTTGIHVQAKVCACFYNEKGELKIVDKKGIIVYPKYIILIAIISLILLPLIAYRKGKKKSKPPEEIEKKASKEVEIPEPEEGREKLNFLENEIKQHEATISEPEDMEGVLKETYPEKDAARLANAFRIAQDIRNNYCDTNTKAKEINKEFDLLKMYLMEKEFLDEIEGIQRKINAELREDERLDEKHVEEVKDFCEKFTEMWIARFLR
jgi:hypothetical protein